MNRVLIGVSLVLVLLIPLAGFVCYLVGYDQGYAHGVMYGRGEKDPWEFARRLRELADPDAAPPKRTQRVPPLPMDS